MPSAFQRILLWPFIGLLLGFLLAPGPMMAQGDTLRGTLSDHDGMLTGKAKNQLTEEPLPFLYIWLQAPRANPVAGAVTTVDGDFQVRGLSPGDYILSANYSGYISRRIPFTMPITGPVNLDFSLEPSGVNIDTFSVFLYSAPPASQESDKTKTRNERKPM